MKSFSLAVCALLVAPLVAGAASAITPQSIVLSTGLITDISTIYQSNGAGTNIKVQNPVGLPHLIQSASQSFTWNTTEKLGGLGVQVGTLTGWGVSQVQNYELRIYSATGLTGTVGSEISTYTFQMNKSLATVGQWLYFDFGSGLNLTQNSVYFFQLAAVSELGSVLGLASSFGQGNLYASGNGALITSNNVAFASNNWDYNFFLHTTSQAIPEPSSVALLVGGLSLGIVSLRRRRG